MMFINKKNIIKIIGIFICYISYILFSILFLYGWPNWYICIFSGIFIIISYGSFIIIIRNNLISVISNLIDMPNSFHKQIKYEIKEIGLSIIEVIFIFSGSVVSVVSFFISIDSVTNSATDRVTIGIISYGIFIIIMAFLLRLPFALHSIISTIRLTLSVMFGKKGMDDLSKW